MDREENCRLFHGRMVTLADTFIVKLNNIGVKVVDTNPAFVEECVNRELYLPDGHWNSEGNRLFAEELKELLGL